MQKYFKTIKRLLFSIKIQIEMMLISVVIQLTIIRGTLSNLIRDGDFEAYSLLNVGNSVYFNIPSDILMWYVKNSNESQVEIKNLVRLNLNTTYGVDLSTNYPVTLCQNVNLSLDSKYSLSYSIFSDIFTNISAKAYINDDLVRQLFITDPNKFESSQPYEFYPKIISNSICFNQTHIPQFNFDSVGAMIDNISLILVERQSILFDYYIYQLQGIIILQTNIIYNQLMVNHFIKTNHFQIQQRQVNYQVINSSDGFMQIRINFNFSFNQNSICFVSDTNANGTAFDFSYAKPFKNKYYYNLNENQISFLNKTKSLLVFLNQILSKVSIVSRIFFVSYFISSIVDAHFLSLFYVFIQPEIIPEFVKQFYYDILQIIFSSQSLPQYIQKLLGMPPDQVQLTFENRFPEGIQDKKNDQPWFGKYQISSRIVTSNISNIMTLCLIIIKFRIAKLILRLLRKIIPESIKKHFKIKTTIYVLLLTQFCFMTPTLVLSCIANIMSPANNFVSKIYNVFSLNLMLLIIGCLTLYIFLPSFLMTYQKNIKIKKHKQKSNEKQTKHNGNSGAKYSEDALMMPLFFFIPFGIYFGNIIFFFVINGLVILLRLYGFFKFKIAKISSFQKFTVFINMLLWVIHHLLFVILWFMHKEDMNELQLQKVCQLGILAVFTVVAIFVVQLIKFVVMTLKGTKKIENFIQKLKKQYNEGQEKQRQEEISKNNVEKEQIKQRNKTRHKNRKKKQIVFFILDGDSLKPIQNMSSQKKNKPKKLKTNIQKGLCKSQKNKRRQTDHNF